MARGEKNEAGDAASIDLAKLSDIGKRFTRLPSSRDVLTDLLKEASALFMIIKQQPGQGVLSALQPSIDALVERNLLKHKDKDIQVLVASCISEVLRIVAPDAPFTDEIWEEIFELIVATFRGLNDISSPYFATRLHILSTVASVRSCIVMLNIECNDLIHEMFQTFFATVRDKPIQMMSPMKKIMSLILLENEEEIPQPLIEVLLTHLLNGRKGVSSPAYILAGAVFEECANHIKEYVEAFLTSILSEVKSSKSKWRDSYHDLIFEIYIRAPSLIIHLIPKLKDELLSEKVDVRTKAVKLVGRLFASRKGVSEKFDKLFSECLKRFNDKSVDVRLAMVECSKQCLACSSSTSVAEELLNALSEHIQDVDERVRMQVVAAICGYAMLNPQLLPVNILKRVSERLRDTEVHVRHETLQRLTGVYQALCSERLQNPSFVMESFNWIPSKLIRCCFDKECKELRAQAMEVVFSEQLFPADFPVIERTKCWISFFSAFDENDVKALERILQQKQRLQIEMQNYLRFQPKVEDEENTKRLLLSCKNMGPSFMDPANAESELQELIQLKDGKLLKVLSELLDPNTTLLQAVSLKKNLLERIDEKHPRHEFLKVLSVKCSYILFGREHMRALVTQIEDYNKLGDEKFLRASMGLLVVFARYFPSLLEGLEENIMELLKDDRDFLKEGSVQIFGSLQGQVTEDSNSVDLLEKLCVEGTRKQVKYAVKALAAISGDSGLKIFSTLYRKLLDLLVSGVNLSTVLQSLGCIAQHDVSVFETSEDVLVNFLTKDLFRRNCDALDEELGDHAVISETTRLKIFGIRTLVKSFLPKKDVQQVQRFKGLSGILLKFLECGEVSDEIQSSRADKDHLRLAAGKAFLQVSKRYDAQISAPIFHAVVLLAMDSCDFVKHGFLKKLKKLLKERAVPEKYVCALALSVGGDVDDELLTEVKQELGNFVETSRRQARLRDVTVSGQSDDFPVIHFPEYVLFHYVHTLAQGANFPSLAEGGPSIETVNPFFRQLSLYVWALLNNVCEETEHDAEKEEDLAKYALILSIFRKMKLAEDKIDATKTENTHILCDIGITIVKDLSDTEIPNYKDEDKIPLPVSIYNLSENAKEENKLDGSYLPAFFIEGDNFSQMKSSLPFLMEMVSKKQRREGSKGSLNEKHTSTGEEHEPDKESVDEENESEKQNRVNESSGYDEDQDANPLPPAHIENHKGSEQKKSRRERIKSSENETNVLKPESIGPASPKRSRRGRTPKDQETVKKPAIDKSSDNAEVNAELNAEDHPMSEMASADSTTPGIDGSARKRVRISIKSPKPPEETLNEVVRESRSELKRHASKQEGSADAKTPVSKREVSADAKTPASKRQRSAETIKIVSQEGSTELKRSKTKKEIYAEPKKSILKEASAEAKRPRGRKNVDDQHGDASSKAAEEAELVRSPRGTPRRSAKKIRISGLETPHSKSNKKVEGKDLVGSRIRVWWPLDKKFYDGKVQDYDEKLKKHMVVYEDGDVEKLKLNKERWELVKDTEDELGSPSTPASSEPGIQSKRSMKSSQMKGKSRGGSSSSKRSYKKSKRGEKSTPTQAKVEADEEVEAKSEGSEHNSNDGVEASDQEQLSDGENTPSSKVLKVEAKSSRPSSKKAIGQLKGRLSKSTSVKPTPEDSAASPTESRESKDSDDVPLDEWKSARKKARLQE